MAYEPPDRDAITLLEKRRALARAALSKPGGGLALDTISPQSKRGPSPLSCSQERLWFLDKWNPDSALYNVPILLRLDGPLHADCIQRALQAVAERHDILRSRLPEIDGAPAQVVIDGFVLPFEVSDLSGLDLSARAIEAERIVQEELSTPFDLAAGPLIRVRLVRKARTEHVLAILLHHSVTDAWSRRILLGELASAYSAYISRDYYAPPSLAIQYADYAKWQRLHLEDQSGRHDRDFWLAQLSDAPRLLDIPTDRPRPCELSHRGHRYVCTLESELLNQLKLLAADQKTSLYMTLFAAFQVLLHRYSGQEDFVVGTPIANRRRRELEPLIGFFTNTLAIRANLSGDPTFRELLENVRSTTLQSYEHQDWPFERLVEDLQPERDASYAPIFQVLFMLQHEDSDAFELPGIDVSPYQVEQTTAKFDLTASAIERQGGLELALDYSTDLFDRNRIERMALHFRELLCSVCSDPCEHITLLRIVPRDEIRLLDTWNDTASITPESPCVTDLFEEQVAATPNATAVVFGDTEYSYADLDLWSSEVAADLQAAGVTPGDRVAVCAERSAEMMAAVLGIMKTGAAYVPIDTSNPAERVARICSNADVACVMTWGDVDGALRQVTVQSICVAPLVRDVVPDYQRSSISPESPCYVIYTSGSTGMPKGAVLPHRALANLVYWHLRSFARQARVLQYMSIGFDVSFQEMFSTWCSGGTLILTTEDQRHDPEQLANVIVTSRVERVFLPAAMLKYLAEAMLARPETECALKQVIVSGEQLKITPEVKDAFSRLRACELHNHYGPSETHVITSYALAGDPHSWDLLPPVGTPIDNVQIYVLDDRLQRVPIGVYGELYAGGDALAVGYLNSPDLTADRFVPDPFAGAPGARMYRTGDVARFHSNGTVEYAGRKDVQVKIRGFRVECGEVEAVLLNLAEIRDAAVVVGSDRRGDNQLVAYVSPSVRPLDTERLRQRLHGALPSYMVPSVVVELEELPHNRNGKVDRGALPDPKVATVNSRPGGLEPSGAIQEIVAQIWCKLLRLETVDAGDNFFLLGGHSLLAAQLAARVRQAFGTDLPLRAVFDYPTIAQLASYLATTSRACQGISQPEIPRADRGLSLPLSFEQERLWFMDQLRVGTSLHNMPVCFRVTGPIDTKALRQAVVALQQRHEVLRTSFPSAEGVPTLLISEHPLCELVVTDLCIVNGEHPGPALQRAIDSEVRLPFDLSTGPLIRVCLISIGPVEHVLVITIHHIITDEVSCSVILSDLDALYHGYRTGDACELPALTLHYADYAAWQRTEADSGRFDVDVAYWKRKLADAPPLLEVPTDYARPPSPTFSRASHRFDIPASTFAAIRRVSSDETATPFMFFLAAFTLLLSRKTNRTDLLIGTDALNRDRPETQRMVGFFINQLVLRIELGDCVTFRDLVRRVREVSLEAYYHQDMPFNRLVELLKPQRDRERPPIYQVKIAYVKGTDGLANIDGLQLERLTADKGTAHLDFTLFVHEHKEGAAGRLEYRDELYRPATAASMTTELISIIQFYSDDLDKPLVPAEIRVRPARGLDSSRAALKTRLQGKSRAVRDAAAEEVETLEHSNVH